MKGSAIVIMILLCYTSLLAQDQERLHVVADSLRSQQQYQEAVEIYDSLIKQNDTVVEYFTDRAYAYSMWNKLGKAKEDYFKALSLDSACWKCYMSLAEVLGSQRSLDSAMTMVNRAIELKKSNGKSYALRAKIYNLKGDQVAASMDFNYAIELDPDSAYGYIERGNYNLTRGYSFLAAKDFSKALELDPQNTFALRLQTEIYTKNQEWDKALRNVNSCLEIDSLNFYCLSTKATILYFQGYFKEALPLYNAAIKVDSSDYLIFYNRALTRYKLEDMDGTCTDYAKALERIEDNPVNQSTINEMQRSIDELCDPSAKSYFYHRGIAAYNLEQFDKAIEYYDVGLKKFPDSPMILSFKGNALIQQEKYREAIEFYSKSLNRMDSFDSEIKSNSRLNQHSEIPADIYEDGTVADVYSSMSEAHANLNQFTLSLAYSDSAIAILNKYSENESLMQLLSYVYNIRGTVNRALGNNDKALEDFTMALSSFEANPLAHANLALAMLSTENLQQKSIYLSLGLNGANGIRQTADIPIIRQDHSYTRDKLLRAASECDRAIELNDELALAYIVRAEIKMILGDPTYCNDLLTARELGVDVINQLDKDCR